MGKALVAGLLKKDVISYLHPIINVKKESIEGKKLIVKKSIILIKRITKRIK